MMAFLRLARCALASPFPGGGGAAGACADRAGVTAPRFSEILRNGERSSPHPAVVLRTPASLPLQGRVGLLLGIVSTLVLAAPASAEVTPQQFRSVVESTIANYLRPEFAALAVNTKVLKLAMAELCRSPSAATQDVAKTEFRHVVVAWSRVEYARLGPVIEKRRLERFSFWPDKKGIGLRQVQKIIADKDETATQAATLAGKSVATQGLQALEFVMFGTGSEALATGDDFRCRYGAAIAENLEGIAAEMSEGWNDESGYVALMRKPGPDNAVYRTDAEAAGDVIELLTTGFQFIRDVKIGDFIGDTPQKAKPRLAAFWRSGQSFAVLQANFAGLRTLWNASGLRPLLETIPAPSEAASGASIARSADFEFNGVERDFAKGFKAVEEAVKDPVEHNRIGYLRIVAGSLWRYFAEDTMSLLGLRMGFNALDGD